MVQNTLLLTIHLHHRRRLDKRHCLESAVAVTVVAFLLCGTVLQYRERSLVHILYFTVVGDLAVEPYPLSRCQAQHTQKKPNNSSLRFNVNGF